MSARARRHAETSQRAAADPYASVFVTANAGSGKTKVLVDRIARLLLEGSRPSAFLCITYTKAAAAEMQRRLFERLGSWCVADDATLASELERLEAPMADLGLARALFARALETPGGLKIQTIHAFCERLLARFPLEAQAPPGFDIADEASAAALLSAARSETALAPDAPLGAFRRLARRLSGEALEALLDRLALRRGEFRRFAEAHQGPIFAEAALRNRHGARRSVEALERDFAARCNWAELARAADVLANSSKSDRDAARRLEAALQCARSEASGALLDACFKVAFTQKGGRYQNMATVSSQKAHPWLEPILADFADACEAARSELTAIDRAEDIAAILALALRLDQAYASAKQRASALDFDDLIERAQFLLHGSNAAAWVLYKLDGGIDHLLIDEGQDTSPAQWDLLAPIQNEFFAGAGARARTRTVFAVGDPKQSIYGFQGADPRRFLSERQSISRRAHQASQVFRAPDLLTSFRSAAEVLAAVDATLANKPLIDVALAQGDLIEHLAFREREPGCVEVWPLAMRPPKQPASAWEAPVDVESGVSAPALLARALARHVRVMIESREAVWDKGKLRPLGPGDVLALVRKRGPLFRELIKSFKREELPVAGADRMVLRDELAVADCLALMRVALDPGDDLSLACVLKGPWLGLDNDDDDIFPLAYGRAPGERLLARLMSADDPKFAAAQSFVKAIASRSDADAFSFLSWALEHRHFGGRSGWEQVLTRLGEEARDPIEELLQRALKPSGAVAATPQRFLYEIDADAGQVKREMEGESGAVRVMTVHGAKGLEAPVVLLPDTTAGVEDKAENGLIFDATGAPFASFRSADDDPVTSAARAAHEARMHSEHWRLLYVAMTRARDRLIVCGAQHGQSKLGEDGESWRLAVEEGLQRLGATECQSPFGAGLRYGEARSAPISETSQPERARAPDWLRRDVSPMRGRAAAAPSRARHALSPFSPRGDGLRRFRRGQAIHQLLHLLPRIHPNERSAAGRTLTSRLSVPEAEAEEHIREAIQVIDGYPELFGSESRGEAPIAGEVHEIMVSGVVDRIAVVRDSVTIVDFKSDRPAPADAASAPEAYVLQLALYREVLKQIFPSKPVACALLWTETPVLTSIPGAQLDEALACYLSELNP